jgi:Sec-independent protein translocase protein TatA
MFQVGFWECMVVLVVALLVVDPAELPKLAQRLGRCIGHGRRSVQRFWQQSQHEERDSGDGV